MNNKKSLQFKELLKYLLVVFYALILITNMFGQTEATLVSNWSDPDNIPAGGGERRYNDCWGFEHEGTEYGVIGSTLGTHIIDLDNTDSLSEVAFIPGKFSSNRVVHRDHHEYNGYLYAVCDQGTSSLQVIDVSKLPGDAPVVYEDSVNIMRAHNVFIDTAKLKMYTCGARLPDFRRVPLQVWSIEDPEKPELLSSISQIEGVDVGYVHDMYARNDTVFLNAGNQGLVIADMTDVNNPKLFGVMANYPDAGYNHSGWWNERGDRYYLADETHGRDIKIVDVSDIRNPRVIQLIEAESDPEGSIVHNLIVKNDMLYVSYYFDGLQVFDVSGDTSTCWAYNYPTSELEPVRGGFGGAWGVYPLLPSGRVIISDMQNGMFLFEIPELQASDSSGVDGTPPCQPVPPTANWQIIHNSPGTPVDVYVNDSLFLDDFEYTDATSMLQIAAEVELNIDIAPANSSSSADAIFTETVTLEELKNYLVFAEGLVGDMDAPFGLSIVDNVKLETDDPEQIEFLIHHGSPDAPSIDLGERNGNLFLTDLFFRETSEDYLAFDPGNYFLSLYPSGAQDAFKTYLADLNGFDGLLGVIYAAGWVNNNSADDEFRLLLVLPDGQTLVLPEVFFSDIQVLHNSPDAAVDVFVTGIKVIEGLEFRQGTAPIELATTSGDYEIAIAPEGGSINDAIYSATLSLEKDENYLLVAEGILGDAETPFNLQKIEDYRLESNNESTVDILAVHGSPDAPEVDILANGSAFIEDIAFGESEEYLTVAPSNYELSVTPAQDNNTILGRYLAELEGAAGSAVTVFASGLLAATPEFGLWGMLTDGTTFPLPLISSTVERIEDNIDLRVGPNPAGTFGMIHFSKAMNVDRIDLVSVQGQVLRNYQDDQLEGYSDAYKFDLNGVSSGSYILRIITEDKTYVSRISVIK